MMSLSRKTTARRQWVGGLTFGSFEGTLDTSIHWGEGATLLSQACHLHQVSCIVQSQLQEVEEFAENERQQVN